MSKLTMPRDLLARIAQGNPLAIKQLERVLKDVGETLPDAIDEVSTAASQALVVAQLATAMLTLLGAALERLDAMPAPLPLIDPDDHTPRTHLGTISTQNHDSVEITGGTVSGVVVTSSTVDSTPIGQTTAAAASFTTVTTAGQVTSTVATGTAPLVITSTTKVANLYVDRAALADNATTAATASNLGTAGAYPADATDLASAITLVNYIKSRNTSKGV